MFKDLLFKLMAVLMLVSMTNLANGQGMSCDMAEVVTVGTYTLSDTIPSNGNNTNPPAGTGGAADGAVWYTYTATETGTISVNACLGGADTRLFVYSGACDALVAVDDNDDACLIVDGGNAWASSVEDVSVVAGTTYYIEWDNNWENTIFTWSLTFTPPSELPDVDVAAAHLSLYLQLPASQSDLWGLIGNLGTVAILDGVLTANVYAADDLTTAIFTVSSEPQTLAVGEVTAINLGAWTPVVGNNYVITYSASVTGELESELLNNSEEGQAFLVTNATYALDSGLTNTFGTNSGNEIIQGNLFTYYSAETVESVSLSYVGGVEGEAIALTIWSVDAAGTPVEEVYNQAIAIAGGAYNVALDTPFSAEQGSTYLVGIRSTTAVDTSIGIGLDVNNYYPGVSIFKVGDGDWTDSSAVVPFAYTIRLNTASEAVTAPLTLSVDMNSEDVGDNGVYLAGDFNSWSADANEMMDADGDGVYTITVDFPINVVAQYKFLNGPSFDFVESVPMECGVDDSNGGFNRSVTISDVSTLALVCFSECATCPIIQEACTNPDAVICDNFDGYSLGDVSAQSDIWTPWPGGASANVSSEQAQSGTSSLLVSAAEGADQILLFPTNVTTGNYTARWSYYVPAGTTAYFNLQGDREDIGGTFKMECIFNGDGTGSLNAGGGDVATFTYPEDQWFDITHFMDFDNDWIQLVINGAPVYQWLLSDDSGAAGGVAQVGAVNFFPNSATSAFYVDDVEIVAVPSCADASIICDPMETYFVGASGTQSSWWSTWSGTEGGAEDGEISLDYSNGGEKSLKLTGGGSQDVILLLGNQTEGRFRLALDMYIEGSNTGYYNIQEDETPAVQWNLDVFADGDGTGRLVADGAEIATFAYTPDSWTNFENIIDIDNSTMIVSVNGTEVFNGVYIGAQIGSVNLYPADASAIFYVDNVNFSELEPIAADPVAVTFTVLTSSIEVDADGMFIAGSFNEFTNLAMTNNGDDSWSVTVDGIDANAQIEYKFKNGPEGWEEIPAGDCVQGDFNNRFLDVAEDDVTVDAVCFATCEASCPSSTIDVEFDSAIAVTPNPSNGVFTVTYNMEVASDLNISVTNMLGQVVVVRTVDNALAGTEGFDLTNMPAGTYTLVTTTGERLSTKRIILQ